jgi:KUP system potassium uptake protein
MTLVTKKRKALATLTLGALGVVFGDIGTSPLYALQAIFGRDHSLVANPQNIYGILSLIIWAITLVVSVKFVGFLMQAHNGGEGGVMAQVALLKSSDRIKKRTKWLVVAIGLVGVSLFYGDSAITPAISVMSAVEGLKVITPSLGSVVVPITVTIIVLLFWLQKYGTSLIGKVFGPVMCIWFLTIGLAGALQVWQHPDMLRALSPLKAVDFFVNQPVIAFVAMGAVILAITGAEALYADMGHFGRGPISRAWFFLVFPALVLCYMGQGALLLYQPYPVQGVFFHLFPLGLQPVIIVLATIATVIASQSVISGAFSLTRQAIQLNFLPKLFISHTSDRAEGQIYIPFVNFLLFVAVILLVIFFGASEKLANAYGIAVSGTLMADTLLFSSVLYFLWRKPAAAVFAFGVCFLMLDLLFIGSSASKIFHGGWIPLLIAVAILIVIDTWQDGQRIVTKKRRMQEGPLEQFIEDIHRRRLPVVRIPGQAVYIGHHPGFTPLALRNAVEDLHELHEKAVIIFVETLPVPHVPEEQRAEFDGLKYNDGISQLRLRYGFHDLPNIPRALKAVRKLSPELDFDANRAAYFISLTRVLVGRRHILAYWRKSLYCLLANYSLSRGDYYNLPINQTMEVRTLIEL